MAEHPLKGAFKFADPGLDKIKIKKERPGLVSLVIENNIETKVNYPMGKQEALKLAAQLMCAFDYD
jgi:hypothetical protein